MGIVWQEWKGASAAVLGVGCQPERPVFHLGYGAGSEVPALLAQCPAARGEAVVLQGFVRWLLCCSDPIGKGNSRVLFQRFPLSR